MCDRQTDRRTYILVANAALDYVMRPKISNGKSRSNRQFQDFQRKLSNRQFEKCLALVEQISSLFMPAVLDSVVDRFFMKFVKADIFVVSQRQEQFDFDSPNVQLSRSAEAFFDKFKRRD